ncbi:TlpA family protein disulfide reductase [Actinoplanes sp. NPDC051494]|uniref:TlpA family protein disulfide reductase n=1 Tax=Actinoplanes sp. NPDC051494 TaxID=3363907 RepID=UPI00378C39CA
MRSKVLLGTAALLLGLTGCGSPAVPGTTVALPAGAAPASAATATVTASAGTASAGTGPAIVPAALTFTGTTVDGTPFDAATLAGKPTILWFWAPWCTTCYVEAMSIHDLQKEYAGRLNILGVAGLGGNAAMHEFVRDGELEAVTHLDDKPGRIWKKFGITEQSVYVVLDATGKVLITSYLDDQQLTKQVKALVA